MSENKQKPAQLSLLDQPKKKPDYPERSIIFGTPVQQVIGSPVQVVGSGMIASDQALIFNGINIGISPVGVLSSGMSIGAVEITDPNVYHSPIRIDHFSSLTNEDVAVIARAVKNAATLTDSKNIADFLSYWTNTTPEVAATIAEKLESTINEEK